MSTKTIPGTFVVLGINESGSVTAIGSSTESTLSMEVDMPETTTKDSGGWAEHLEGGGVRSFTIESSGLSTVDSSGSPAGPAEKLANLVINQETFDFEFTVNSTFATNNSLGGSRYTGKATINSFSESFPMEEGATYEVSATGNGPLTVDFTGS